MTPATTPRSRQRSSALVALLVLAASLVVGMASPAAAADGTVSGTVTSSVGGVPVAGVTVQAYGGAYGALYGTTSTAANGTFSLVLPAGTFKIRYLDPSGAHTTVYWGGATTYATAAGVVVPSAGTVTADWAMTAAAQLNGTVTAALGGSPVVGATVEMIDSTTSAVLGTSTTGAGGTWASAVKPGSYKLRVTGPVGFLVGYSGGGTDLASATTIVVNPGATVTHDISLPSPAALSGTVTTPGGSGSGITVEVLDPVWGSVLAQGTTGGSGDFTVPLAPGTYRVRFHDPAGAYADLYSGNSLDWAGSSTIVVAGGAATDLDATLQRNARVHGRVRSAPFVWAPGIKVEALNVWNWPVKSATSAADGTYVIDGLPPGTYKIRFSDPGGMYATNYESGAITFDAAPSHTLAVGDLLVVNHKVVGVGGLTGTGTIGTFGPGAPNIYVGAFDAATLGLVGLTQTASDGTWSMPTLPPGTYKVAYVDPRWFGSEEQTGVWQEIAPFSSFRPVFVPSHDIDSEGLANAAAAGGTFTVTTGATTPTGAQPLVGYHCNPTTHHPGADLTGWNAPDGPAAPVAANLAGCDLTGANLTDAFLPSANLRYTNLTDANLSDATLYQGIRDTFNGIFEEWPAVMTGARITGADFTGAVLPTEAVLTADPDWTGTNLDGRKGVPMDFDHWPPPVVSVFGAGIDQYGDTPLSLDTTSPPLLWDGATFREAMIDHLAGATIEDFTCHDCLFGTYEVVWFLPGYPPTLISTAELSGVQLPGADLSGSDLSGADLSGADLSGADLTNIICVGTDFSGADLSGADLTGANCADADFTGANLWQAELTGTMLTGATITGATFKGSNGVWLGDTAPDWSGADLAGLDLSWLDLGGHDLTGTKLNQAYLENSSLAGSIVAGTVFGLANLSYVDLTGATGTPVGWGTATYESTTCPDGTVADPGSAQTTCVGHHLP